MNTRNARFIAIPVTQGDAFYLKTASGSVLVDGGRAISGFADLFAQTTGAKSVDIVICTHNDADHANGLIGFFGAGLECAEVWLPGRWSGVLPHVLSPAPEVAEALAEQAREAATRELGKHLREGTVFEAYGDLLAQEQPKHGEDREPTAPEVRAPEVTPGGWPETLTESLERAVWEAGREGLYAWPWDWVPWRLPHWWVEPPPHWRHVWRVLHFAFEDPVAAALFLGAVDAAERIRKIAAVAYHRGVAVRWFEYASPQGGTRWLRPLNANEIAYVPAVPIDRLLAFFALTTANRESLVFWADLDDCPGVLFTADSDLTDVDLSAANLSRAIVTAPHHGSEDNARAYSEVCKHLGPSQSGVTWVRSDGRFKRRPGPAYLSAPGRRICTICRTARPQPKQAVRLLLSNGNWTSLPSTRLCRCV